jgi:transglutaminase-like putative cysteine protease
MWLRYKPWFVFGCAMACSHSAPPAGTQPTVAGAPQRPTQKVLITRQDFAPIDPKRFLYVFPIEPSEAIAKSIKVDEHVLSDADTAEWCLRLNLRRLDKDDRRDLLRRLGVRDGHKDFVRLPWKDVPPRDKPLAKDLESTFVIDYDDPRFQKFWSAVESRLGEHPSVNALVNVVAKHIEVKTTTRMFDTASEVAYSHRGDCTEHAALLTALLRRSGKPARLVTGLAVLVEGHDVGAFGHAWSEFYEAGTWHVIDAALHPVPGHVAPSIRAMRYVPVVRMVDEGAGFAAAMHNVRSIEAISSVRVEACQSLKKRR